MDNISTPWERAGNPMYRPYDGQYSTIPAAKIMIGVAVAGALAYLLVMYCRWIPFPFKEGGLTGKEFSDFVGENRSMFRGTGEFSRAIAESIMAVIAFIGLPKLIAIGAVISLIPLFAKWRVISLIYLLLFAIAIIGGSAFILFDASELLGDSKDSLPGIVVLNLILIFACIVGTITAIVTLYKRYNTDKTVNL